MPALSRWLQKQGLKIAFAKRYCTLWLYDFVKHCGPVLNRLGKYLQQIPFIVSVYQNVEVLSDSMSSSLDLLFQLSLRNNCPGHTKLYPIIPAKHLQFLICCLLPRQCVVLLPFINSMYSSICDFLIPLAGSLMGNLMYPLPLLTTLLIRAVYLVEISLCHQMWSTI